MMGTSPDPSSSILALSTPIASSAESKSTAEGDLTVTSKELAVDIEEKAGLHQQCMAKAEDFDLAALAIFKDLREGMDEAETGVKRESEHVVGGDRTRQRTVKLEATNRLRIKRIKIRILHRS